MEWIIGFILAAAFIIFWVSAIIITKFGMSLLYLILITSPLWGYYLWIRRRNEVPNLYER